MAKNNVAVSASNVPLIASVFPDCKIPVHLKLPLTTVFPAVNVPAHTVLPELSIQMYLHY